MNATRSVEELEVLLARAEKAIDVQGGHIITLTAKLQEFACGGGDSGYGDGSAEGEVSDLDSSTLGSEAGTNTPVASPSRGSKQPSAEQVLLIENMQSEVLRLTQDLDDSTQDSHTKAGELEDMGHLLKDKERLLFEAGDLLQEARRHYEAQRERCETLVREKAETAAQLELVQGRLGEQVESVKFALSESQVSVDTLRAENKSLLAEIADVTGDSLTSRAPTGAGAATGPSKPARPDLPTPPVGRRTSASTMVCTTSIKSRLEREAENDSRVREFESLCAEHKDSSVVAATAALVAYVTHQLQSIDSEVVNYEGHIAALEKAQADTSKRVKELEVQRDRLEVDLGSRTETAVRAKLELEAYTAQALSGAGNSTSAALVAMHEKERAQTKSLQQRLEQLVAVHRQLLRKFASLELESSEVRKKLTLRDERIHQLEDHARSSTAHVRDQSERHVAELTNLREQIRLMKEEHMQRKDQQQHYLDLQLLNTGGRESTSGPRKMRGGHSNTADNSTSIGRPKSIAGGSGLGQLRGSPVGGSTGIGPKTVGGGGGCSEGSNTSSFSNMMARLGVSK